MKNNFIYIFLLVFLTSCTNTKIKVLYQKDKTIKFSIIYKNLTNIKKTINGITNIDSLIIVKIGDETLLSGYHYYGEGLISSFHYNDKSNILISCKDEYKFKEINYGNKKIICSLYPKQTIEDNDLLSVYNNMKESLILKFVIKN